MGGVTRGTATGASAPRPVEIYRDLRGNRYARVCTNVVEQVADMGEDGEVRFFEWDECTFPLSASHDEAYVAEHASRLEYEAERASMDEAAWRADVDQALLDIMEVLL